MRLFEAAATTQFFNLSFQKKQFKRMKEANKLFWAIIVIFAVWLFVGCTDHTTTTDPTKPVPTAPTSTEPPVVTMAASVPVVSNYFCEDTVPTKGVLKARAVLLKNKNWTPGQTLTIGFIGGTEQQRQRVKDAYAEWAKYANLKFVFPTSGQTNHRWSFSPGSAYSYIGTDCNFVQQQYNTGNIGFNQNGLSVELHEVGHALGMGHEQSSPNSTICWNKPVVYTELAGPPNYWSQATVDANVFAKYSLAAATATVFDPVSIMCYKIKANWTCDGLGIPGGIVLSDLDKSAISTTYPGVTIPPVINPPNPSGVTLTATQVAVIKTALNQLVTADSNSYLRAQAARQTFKSAIGQ